MDQYYRLVNTELIKITVEKKNGYWDTVFALVIPAPDDISKATSIYAHLKLFLL